MRQSIRKALRHDDSGFTLIELLVVMIIIGILAGIAIPVFMNQQNKARDTALRSDVSSVAKEISSYYVDNSDSLTAAISGNTLTLRDSVPADVATVNLSSDNTVMETGGTSYITNSTTWCVAMTQTQTTTTVHYHSSNGLGTGVCTT